GTGRMPNATLCRSEPKPPVSTSTVARYSSGVPMRYGHHTLGLFTRSEDACAVVTRIVLRSFGPSVTGVVKPKVSNLARRVPVTAASVAFHTSAMTVRSADFSDGTSSAGFTYT